MKAHHNVVLQQQGWKIMFEVSQKEWSELPGQERGKDRKEHKEGASMSDRADEYVEIDEAGMPRSSGFSQSNSKV